MNPELLILRHGKSDWSVTVDDFDRPLKNRGKRGAQRMGAWLQAQGIMPDRVLSSPAERAKLTAEKSCKVMGMHVSAIRYDQRLYEADMVSLLEVLKEVSNDTRRLLLVGHNPGLEALLSGLVDSPIRMPKDGKLLPTATLAQLKLSTSWADIAPNTATLWQIIRPGEIPALFPVETPKGIEYRKRPAYYYTQSGVLPYRIEQGELKILLVRSSSLKNWVFPKGIAEPGYSLSQSAAKEALEEAGIEGIVGKNPLGQFEYSKWGASCHLTVYPMEVSRELAEDEWEENHRGRVWLNVDQALERLNFPEAAQLVKGLLLHLKN